MCVWNGPWSGTICVCGMTLGLKGYVFVCEMALGLEVYVGVEWPLDWKDMCVWSGALGLEGYMCVE